MAENKWVTVFFFTPFFFHGVISTYLCLQLVPLGPPSCRYRQKKMGFLGLTNQLGNLPMDSPHPAFVQLPTNPPYKNIKSPSYFLVCWRNFHTHLAVCGSVEVFSKGRRCPTDYKHCLEDELLVNFHPWKKENHLQKWCLMGKCWFGPQKQVATWHHITSQGFLGGQLKCRLGWFSRRVQVDSGHPTSLSGNPYNLCKYKYIIYT